MGFVSRKRQRGTSGQGILVQIQAIGLVISLKPGIPCLRFGLTKKNQLLARDFAQTRSPSLALRANEEKPTLGS